MKDKYTPVVNLLIAMKQKGVINSESMYKCIDDIRHALGKEQEIIEQARIDSAESILKSEHWDENWYFNRFQNPVII